MVWGGKRALALQRRACSALGLTIKSKKRCYEGSRVEYMTRLERRTDLLSLDRCHANKHSPPLAEVGN